MSTRTTIRRVSCSEILAAPNAQHLIVCRDAVPAFDCDWEVRDADEDEVLESVRTHIEHRSHFLPLLAGVIDIGGPRQASALGPPRPE